jgi:hypothetical protein
MSSPKKVGLVVSPMAAERNWWSSLVSASLRIGAPRDGSCGESGRNLYPNGSLTSDGSSVGVFWNSDQNALDDADRLLGRGGLGRRRGVWRCCAKVDMPGMSADTDAGLGVQGELSRRGFVESLRMLTHGAPEDAPDRRKAAGVSSSLICVDPGLGSRAP